MAKKRIRRTLSPSELSSIEKMGESIGGDNNLHTSINRSNAFVRKHRRVILPIVVVATAFILGAGIYLDFRRKPSPPILDKAVLPTRDTLYIKDQLKKELEQSIIIADSIQFLLKRGNLSRADSLYITWGVTYIDYLNEHQK